MVKVRGPMFSLSACKTFGKTIVYQRTISGFKAYSKVIPYDPKNREQYFIRAYFGAAQKAWRSLPLGYRQAWNAFVRL
jgi:hypothetical protein